MAKRILLIEDEAGVRMTLADRFAVEGYEVETAFDGAEGFARASRTAYDLIILDLMLPKKSGFDVCRDLRRLGIDTPILMLTARGQVVDKVVGLKLGADDYLTKPFEMAELLARVEARLRPRGGSTTGQGIYRFGPVQVDLRRMEMLREGSAVELSAKEFQLLKYFIEHRSSTLSRDELLTGVWGYDATPSTRTVDVHVAWLRRKLGQPGLIATVHGVGYKFTG
jgi:two-component system alkaline phosphatase synthesis response regulator PhoP